MIWQKKKKQTSLRNYAGNHNCEKKADKKVAIL